MKHLQHTIEISENINIHLLSNPAFLLLGIYSEDIPSTIQKCIRTKLLIVELFIISKNLKQSIFPLIRNPHNEVLCGCKTEQV